LQKALERKTKRVEKLEKQQKSRKAAHSKLEKEKLAAEAALQATRAESRSKSVYNAHVCDELLKVREQLDDYISANPSKEVDELCHEIAVFDGGRYSDTIRLIYYTLLSNGVAPGNCRVVVGTTLKLLNITAARLPSKDAARLMNLERSALSDIQAAELLLDQDDGRAQLAGDEATKLGKSRFGLGFFCEELLLKSRPTRSNSS